MELAEAIRHAENPGVEDCHEVLGGSMEKGCYQYQADTWRRYSKNVLGYIAPRTPINEQYVTVLQVEAYLRLGYTPYQVALIWNAGVPVERSGVNQYGVAYDSAKYARSVLLAYNR